MDSPVGAESRSKYQGSPGVEAYIFRQGLLLDVHLFRGSSHLQEQRLPCCWDAQPYEAERPSSAQPLHPPHTSRLARTPHGARARSGAAKSCWDGPHATGWLCPVYLDCSILYLLDHLQAIAFYRGDIMTCPHWRSRVQGCSQAKELRQEQALAAPAEQKVLSRACSFHRATFKGVTACN